MYRSFALTAVSLLLLGSLAGCGSSINTTAIDVNLANASNTAATNRPANADKTAEPDPVDFAKAPTVSYCELIKDAARYDKNVVRVRAIYFNAFERTYLYDETCQPDQKPTAPDKVPAETWAAWDKSFVSKGDSDEAKTNRQLIGFGRKDVTLVGRFLSTNEQNDKNAPNLFGHMNCCRYQFSILKLEKLNSEIKE